MAKKKNRKRQARSKGQQPAQNPAVSGRDLFHRGDFDGAIATWDKANRIAPSPELRAALAEVHFRRGLARIYKQGLPPAGLADVETATRLAPDEARYAYHLGLAHHRRGDLEMALGAYRRVLEIDAGFGRAAELAGLALLEIGKDPAQDAVWARLNAEQRAVLEPVGALLQGRPPRPPAAGVPPVARLWHGLAAAEKGDNGAGPGLRTLAEDDRQAPLVRAAAASGLALMAVCRGAPDEARAHWETALHLGLDTPAVRSQLASIYAQQAEEAMAGQKWAEAAGRADAALELAGELARDTGWPSLGIAAHLHAGYADAQAGRWEQARQHWERAVGLGENSRAAIQNLALACEKTERFAAAAELWRQVVRRRPRKANAPDALTPQQVALLWGHVADCYRRAGNADEAIKTLRNAVKNDPGNTDLRLQLADGLAAMERWYSLRGELEEILAREPQNLEALVRSARLDEVEHILARARTTWRQVLALQPDHAEARERLAALLLQSAGQMVAYRKLDSALELLREAEQYAPDNSTPIVAAAEVLYQKKRKPAARKELERAFAVDPADIQAYHMAVDMCHINRQPKEAEWVITRAEELGGPHFPDGRLPADFYAGIGECSLDRGEIKQGYDYLKLAEERAVGDAEALADIGQVYLEHRDMPRGLALYAQVLRLEPEHGWANLWVAVSHFEAMNTKEANRHLRVARRTARRTDDDELLEAVEQFSQLLNRAWGLFGRGLLPGELFDDADDDEIF